MRIPFVILLATVPFLTACHAEVKPAANTETANPAKAVLAPKAKAKTTVKTPKKAFMALGGEKPKTSLAGKSPVRSTAERTAEVKRLIDGYHNVVIRYAEECALATTPEAKEALEQRQPSAKTLRSFTRLLANVVAENPGDDPSLDALVFLSRFVEVSELSEPLSKIQVTQTDQSGEESKVDFDTRALLLEHHTNNPKIVDAFRRMPRGDATDTFLRETFNKTFSPQVRWSSGAQLISSLRRNDRPKQMEEIVVAMSEDRYLQGVGIGGKPGGSNARQWAIDKLREIRTLGVGNEFPEVSGKNLDGETENINDYRGKVVVVDIWTTWCGPCIRMIPHVREMTERLKDKPFVFLSVSCDREESSLHDFLKETKMPWNHWWVGNAGDFTSTLNINAYPTVYVIDAEGTIRFKGLRGEALEKAVNELLGELK